MTTEHKFTGGCLCGGVRYAADGKPDTTGYCCCTECRKASGAGAIPFMLFNPNAITISGETRQSRCTATSGSYAVRHHCATCGSLVFGHPANLQFMSVYAGTLDNPEIFEPKIVLFNRSKPSWVVFPPHLEVFESTPIVIEPPA